MIISNIYIVSHVLGIYMYCYLYFTERTIEDERLKKQQKNLSIFIHLE